MLDPFEEREATRPEQQKMMHTNSVTARHRSRTRCFGEGQ